MGSSDQFLKVGSASDVSNVNNFTGDITSLMKGYTDPNAMFARFLSQSPELMNLVFGATSPLGKAYSAQGDILANTAIRDVSNNYANSGALNSGSALSAMTRGAAEPRAALMSSLAGTQTNLLGSLLGTNLQGGYQMANTALGTLGEYGKPEWWQPTYMENPDYMGTKDWLGLGVGLLGTAAGLAVPRLWGVKKEVA